MEDFYNISLIIQNLINRIDSIKSAIPSNSDLIAIVDTANNFTADTVEGALAESAVKIADISSIVLSNVTYQANGSLSQSYASVATGALVTTFRGFSTRLTYSNEVIYGILAYFNAEFAGYTIKCAIKKDDNTDLALSMKTLKVSGWQEMVFAFNTPVTAEMIGGANFRVSLEIMETSGCRLSNGTITNGAKISAASGSPNKYLITGNSSWFDCTSPFTTYSIAVQILGQNNLVAISNPAVLSQDISNWYKEIPLPASIYCVVGHEMNIYFQNLVGDDIRNYLIDVSCLIGAQQNERWTFTPSEAGSWALTISIYDQFLNLCKAVTSTVIAVAADSKSGVNANCLFMGDSTTAAGVYTGELVNNLLGASDPMDINLIGTKGTSPNLYEAIGGCTINQFYSDPTSPFVFSGAFNFSQYMSTNSFALVDWVFMHLGINDAFNCDSDSAIDTLVTANITKLESMITSMKSFNANVKIGFMLTIPPSANQDSFGKNYGSGMTQWRYKRNIHRYTVKMLTNFMSREASNIYVIPTNCNIDTINNMSAETVAVNSRNSATVVRQSNGVHPANSGYYQMADTVYYALKNLA